MLGYECGHTLYVPMIPESLSCNVTVRGALPARVNVGFGGLCYSPCGFVFGFTGVTSPTAGLRGSVTMLGSARVVGLAQ
jgi:hypothetical protein